MGKRRQPVGNLVAMEPWEPTCFVCRTADVSTGAFLERPMIECAFCATCVERLRRESARGRTAKVAWRLLPACSRCGAQVPGMARIPLGEVWDGVETVYLCHQCCVTIQHHAILAQEDEDEGAPHDEPGACPQCGEELATFQNGRIGCLACNTWMEDGRR